MEQEQSQIDPTQSPGESAASSSALPPAQESISETPPPDSATPEKSPAEPPEVESWLTTLQSLLITVTIAVFVITFIVQAFEIPSPSMEKTLLVGDYLLVDKAHYGPAGVWKWLLPYQKVKRGDIVVFYYPLNPEQHFVKRVIGVPGDRIRLRHKRVYVNGTELTEPYVEHIDKSYDEFRDEFPIGSRRTPGIDSNWYLQMDKLVEDSQLIVPEGNYFVMGDNRDDSDDSRYWGFVPRENIVGRPLVIYFSMGSDDETADDRLSLREMFRRMTHEIRWRRVLRLVH